MVNPKKKIMRVEDIFEVEEVDNENDNRNDFDFEYDSSDSDIPDINPKDVEFYDPNEDEKNEQWIQKKTKTSIDKNGKIKRQSDAILTCPFCFTYLCFDCQKHANYSNQYRAMFVKNCTVVKNEIYRLPETESKSKSKHEQVSKEEKEEEEIYHPVNCSVCGTQVALIDQDEIYHFFNVIPSNF